MNPPTPHPTPPHFSAGAICLGLGRVSCLLGRSSGNRGQFTPCSRRSRKKEPPCIFRCRRETVLFVPHDACHCPQPPQQGVDFDLQQRRGPDQRSLQQRKPIGLSAHCSLRFGARQWCRRSPSMPYAKQRNRRNLRVRSAASEMIISPNLRLSWNKSSAQAASKRKSCSLFLFLCFFSLCFA